jgi:hypothetical protein
LVKIDGNQDFCGRGFWRTLAVKRECLAPKPMKLNKKAGDLSHASERKKREKKKREKLKKNE